MSAEADKVKGRVKQVAGDLTDDNELKAEGQADESAGKLKEKIDDAADAARDAIDSVKSKLSD